MKSEVMKFALSLIATSIILTLHNEVNMKGK